MKKSESCSCACGRIATSSVLNTNTNKIQHFLKAVWLNDRTNEDAGGDSDEDGRDAGEADGSHERNDTRFNDDD